MGAPTIIWSGQSGSEYKYWIYKIDTPFNDVSGNYIFAYESSPHQWKPVYIGQTENLKDRLDDHEKEVCAKRNLATHIHTHTNPNKDSRLAEETDLIRLWNPVCNG